MRCRSFTISVLVSSPLERIQAASYVRNALIDNSITVLPILHPPYIKKMGDGGNFFTNVHGTDTFPVPSLPHALITKH